MSDDDLQRLLAELVHTLAPTKQAELRERMRGHPRYLEALLDAHLSNPFLQLTPREATEFCSSIENPAVRCMVSARYAAVYSSAPRHVVFAMPKSGSSFVQSALQHALQLPFVSLTTYGQGAVSSYFGMNSREQELDELAINKAILCAPEGFVAQHHTRYSPYLSMQLRFFGMSPIVTRRNILDCIVSYDDMMMVWRGASDPQDGWVSDPPFALPLNYTELDAPARYRILSRSLGVWLIAFHLSWTRAARQQALRPLLLSYEEDVINPSTFTEKVATYLEMNSVQRQRLQAYAVAPDPQRARLNVGKVGRGRALVPDDVSSFLLDYARSFGSEISSEEMTWLLA